MNYQQYLELKRRCEIKIKIFTFGMYIASMLAFVQTALLVLKVDFTWPYSNLIILDQLYSLGYQRSAEGNVIFALFFYGAFALIAIALIASSFLCSNSKRSFYYLIILIYSADSVLCLATAMYFNLIVHVVVIILLALAVRNIKTLSYLKNNLWGYE